MLKSSLLFLLIGLSLSQPFLQQRPSFSQIFGDNFPDIQSLLPQPTFPPFPWTAATGSCPNPQFCYCNPAQPTVCFRCYDPTKNVSTNCTTCRWPFVMNSSYGCVSPTAVPCPTDYCQCGSTAGVCTSCYDPLRSTASNCQACTNGGTNQYGQCAGSQYLCPAGCNCTNINPRICTSCADVNKNISANCTTCKANYFLLNGYCQPLNCPTTLCQCSAAGSNVCSYCYDPYRNLSTNCASCVAGANLNTATGMCLPTIQCPVFCNCLVPGTCGTCKDQFKNLSTNCTQCISGYVYNTVSNSCQAQAPSSQSCQALLCECTNPYTPKQCTRCYDPNRNLSVNCVGCKVGFTIIAGGACVASACPNYCQCAFGGAPSTCTGCTDPNRNVSASCTTCNNGYVLDGSARCVVLSSCNSNVCVCTGTTCVRCNDINRNFTTGCLACNAGYVFNGSGFCVVSGSGYCPPGCACTNPSAPSMCTGCADPNKNASTSCTACNNGWSIPIGGTTCVSGGCPTYCNCPSSAPSFCLSCTDSNRNLSMLCNICNANFYLPAGSTVCIPVSGTISCPTVCNCPTPYTSQCISCVDPNRNVTLNCTQCNNGFYLNGNTCMSGGGGGQYSCPSACNCIYNVPFYQCVSCQDANRNASTNCAQCNSGYYLPNGGPVCALISGGTTCSNGCNCVYNAPYYQCVSCQDSNKNATLNCTQCNSGYSFPTGGAICVPVNGGGIGAACPSGCNCAFYPPNYQCVSCQDTNKNATLNCTQCKTGYYVPAGSSLCIQIGLSNCPAGCNCVGSGQCISCADPNKNATTTCTQCLSGYFLSGGRCVNSGVQSPTPDTCQTGLVMFNGNCIPECTERCNCVNNRCASCRTPQYDASTFCLCFVGQRLNQFRVCL